MYYSTLPCPAHTGTLLGGGGPLGSGGAIQQFVPDPQARSQLFAAVAYDCQCNQQPDEARELFLAANMPMQALQIINMQLTAAIHSNRGELVWVSVLVWGRAMHVLVWCSGGLQGVTKLPRSACQK